MIDRYIEFTVATNNEHYLPLRSLKGLHPLPDTTVRIYFDNSSEAAVPGTASLYSELTITSGKA